MNYPTYEDRIAQAAEVLRTLTPEQVDAVDVFAGLTDRLGELRQILNGYSKSGPLNAQEMRNVVDYQYRIDLYVKLANALHEARKK